MPDRKIAAYVGRHPQARAWNRSGQFRAVLIVDSGHSSFSEVERAAMTDPDEAVGYFNQSRKLPGAAPMRAGRSSTIDD